MTPATASIGPESFARFSLTSFGFKAVVIGGGGATMRALGEFFLPVGPWRGHSATLITILLWSVICAVTCVLVRAMGKHWQYHRFITGIASKPIESAYVAFKYGRVEPATMKSAWPISDISHGCRELLFSRVRSGE